MKWVIAIVASLIGFLTVVEQEPKPYQFPQLEHFPRMPQNVGNPATVEGVLLGRFLFYDPILSADSSFSCSTCHRQESAFADANERYSSGVHGHEMKRNTMPLFNLAWYRSMFWDGRAATIEDQVFHPVRDSTEMDLSWKKATQRVKESAFYSPMLQNAFGKMEIDSTHIAKAIAQFLRTLISHNSRYDQVIRGQTHFDSLEYAGFELVNDQSMAGCVHCHNTDAHVLGTTGSFSNNGLDAFTSPDQYTDKGLGAITGNPKDIGLFRVPSLRNVMLTSPYMHDGRFSTIEDVLEFYSRGVHTSLNVDSKMEHAYKGGVGLTEHQKECIIAFLKTLTDSTFTTDPEFGNPFEN